MNYDAATHIVCSRELASSRGNLLQQQFPLQRPSANVSSSQHHHHHQLQQQHPQHHVTKEWFWTSVHTGKCQLEEGYSAAGQTTTLQSSHQAVMPPRPLQSREN